MDSNGNQWDKHSADPTYNHASFKRGAASSSSKPPSEPEKGAFGNEPVDRIHPQTDASRGHANKKSTSPRSASSFASQQPSNGETGNDISHRRGEQIFPMPPLPEDPGAKMTNKDLDRIRQKAYATGKGTSTSGSTSGESVFSSLSDVSSQDSQVPPTRPTEARASDKYPSASKPSNPPKYSSPSTANHASRNQQAGIPGGIKIKRLPASSSPNSPPLSQPHHSRGRQQEPSETTGKASRSKPKTRTAPQAGIKEKASPNLPQPDRFDGSQARDDSHNPKASWYQASFKPAVARVLECFVWAVMAPFRGLQSLFQLWLALGWAIVHNFPSVLLCVQGLLALIGGIFGKRTLIDIKDWVSGTAGTIVDSTKTTIGSGTAYVTDAFGWNKDDPYEKLPPVLPLVIHIEIWEPGLKLAARDVDSLQPLIPDLDLGNVARKKKQMPIDKAKWLKELSSLFVSELTKSLGPSRIFMTELLWKIRHHPVKNQLNSDTKKLETSWLTKWWKPKNQARAELTSRLKSALGVFKTSLHDRSSMISKMYGQLVLDSVLDVEAIVCGLTNNLKGQHDFMVQKATESGDDTSRLWLSTHDSENTAGGQAADEDPTSCSKALAEMFNTYSNLNAVCETISLDQELFMEASKQMAKEITHLKKAIKNLETTQKNLKGFSDEQFDAYYAGRVETNVLVELVQTWLDLTKA